MWLRQVFILKKIGCCRRQLPLFAAAAAAAVFSSKPPALAWQAKIWIFLQIDPDEKEKVELHNLLLFLRGFFFIRFVLTIHAAFWQKQ